MSSNRVNIFWFRRDLRIEDNVGLYFALQGKNPVLPLFIFDTDILDQLDNPYDLRVQFIYQHVEKLFKFFKKNKIGFIVEYGKPATVFLKLLQTYEIGEVFTNHDYEPYATERDAFIKNLLNDHQIPFNSHKDQVIFEKNEILKDDGTPYSIYTPYSKRWRATLSMEHLKNYSSELIISNFKRGDLLNFPTLKSMGFKSNSENILPIQNLNQCIKKYDKTRDFPAKDATTHLGVHLRFGTVSIRELVKQALELNAVFLGELIWREFFMMILFHHPRVVNHSFKPKYDQIKWRNDEHEFVKWCEGKTGFPIVDAGMKQLNETGWMHNRVRMIVASFLTKDLLIDWRWGEAYFAQKLIDYELSSNNGNWQWAAGCGCDAAPYFRIFSPIEQTKKFDKELKYIKKWLDEDHMQNIKPIVDHKIAAKRAIETYKLALNSNSY